MESKDWSRLLASLVLVSPAAHVAHAETYLTEKKAVKLLFPKISMKDAWVTLTGEQKDQIEKNSGERVLDERIRIFWGPKKEAVFIDRVIGKHEYITYAVAIDANSKVKGIEIMDYRETYGGEVRQAPWRKQFVGKGINDPIKVEKDITNISGATLSSVHVTDGVRRILMTYDVLRKKNKKSKA